MEPKPPHSRYDLLHVNVKQTDCFINRRLKGSNDPRLIEVLKDQTVLGFIKT